MSSFRCCVSGGSLRASSALSRFFARHGITFKKSLRAEERKRAEVARARRRWIREQGWLDTTRLVFIDETAVTTNMVRLNGWSPWGERLVADAPMGHWETVTFIAGLLLRQLNVAPRDAIPTAAGAVADPAQHTRAMIIRDPRLTRARTFGDQNGGGLNATLSFPRFAAVETLQREQDLARLT
jgi:hypothetical protein